MVKVITDLNMNDKRKKFDKMCLFTITMGNWLYPLARAFRNKFYLLKPNSDGTIRGSFIETFLFERSNDKRA